MEIPRGTQADGRGSDVQDAGFGRALQPVGWPDRVSGPRPAFLLAHPWSGPRGSGARRQDCLALVRGSGCQAGKVEEVSALFDGHLARRGYIARGGQWTCHGLVPLLS